MYYLKRFFILFVLVFSSGLLNAQPAPPESVNGTPLPGLVLMVAAGAAYGARKSILKGKDGNDE